MSNSFDPDLADSLSGLIWVQTVCKSYQRTTLLGNELKGLTLKMESFVVYSYCKGTVIFIINSNNSSLEDIN